MFSLKTRATRGPINPKAPDPARIANTLPFAPASRKKGMLTVLVSGYAAFGHPARPLQSLSKGRERRRDMRPVPLRTIALATAGGLMPRDGQSDLRTACQARPAATLILVEVLSETKTAAAHCALPRRCGF